MGIAADPMPMPAPGAPVLEDESSGERPVMARPPDGGGGSRGGRGVLSNPSSWRVRTKLIAILAIPVVAIIVNALIDASSVLTSTRDINRVSHLVTVDRAAVNLTDKLEYERTFTAQYVTQRETGKDADRGQVTSRQRDVDDAYTAYQKVAEGKRGSFSSQVNEALDSVATVMGNLKTDRSSIVQLTDPVSVQVSFDAVIEPLMDLVALIPQGNDDRQLGASVQAAAHLVKATDLLATQQTQVNTYLVSGQPFTSAQFRATLSTDAERSNELDQFDKVASPAQKAMYDAALNPRNNPDLVNTTAYTDQVLSSPVDRPLNDNQLNQISPVKWLQNTHATTTASYGVVNDLFDQIDSRVGTLRSSIQRQAIFSALFTVIILAAALIITLIVAQSLVRPLFALRTAALDIAERRLPEAVRRLRDSSDQVIDDDVELVGIDTDEEIGEVARAFDEVHREAVRLASEQAVLRNNVNAMFVNLSRRSQGLVERQLRLIDDLENREQDPDQLSNLFKLDHLATRMRRNNESLLVLAGTDTARRWTHPVPLNEVVLAAISEVEQYTRVRQTTAAPVSIAGNGVSDVVHLIAELLENATSYSPPATDVVVTSHSLGPGAGAMIEIVDQGIGMPAKDLERINERLASPPVVDVSVSRTMGLFAVGRLASRHGIRVQLRESPSRGITAVIRLPAKLVTGDTAGGPAGQRPGAASGLGRPGVENAARQGLPAGSAAARPELGGATGPSTGPVRQPFGATQQLGPGQENGHGRRQPEGPDNRDDRFGPPTGAQPAVDRFGPPPLALGPGGQGGPSPVTGPVPTPAPEQPRYTEEDTQRIGSFPGAQPPAGQGQQRGHRQERTEPEYSEPQYREPDYDEQPRGQLTGPVDLRADRTGDFQVSRSLLPDPLDRTGPMPRLGVGPSSTPNDRGSDNDYPTDNGYQPGPAYREPARNEQQENVFARPAHRPEPEPVDVPRPRWEEPPTGGHARPRPEDTGELYVGDGEDVDTTPIFDSVSAWFQRRSPADEPQHEPEPVVEANTPPGAFVAPRASAGMRVMGTAGMAEQQVQRPEPAPAPLRPAASLRTDNGASGDTGPNTGGLSIGGMGGGGVTSGGYRQPGSYADPPIGPRPAQPPLPARGAEPLPVRGAEPPLPVRGAEPPLPVRRAEPRSWESAGDAGWQAAEALRAPTGPQQQNTTKAGLPVRVPMTHLVPGSAEPASNRKPPQRPADAATRSPEAVGGRLASFYQGVRQGRDLGAETRSARRDGQEER